MTLALAANARERRRSVSAAAFGAMRPEHRPESGLKTWLSLAATGVAGANLGALLASALAPIVALALIGAGIGATLIAERRSRRPTEAYYWSGVLLARVGAASLAALLAPQWSAGAWIVGVAAALGATVAFGRARSATAAPATDPLYWPGVLLAGAAGVALGGLSALHLGLAQGAVLSAIALSGLLFFRTKRPAAIGPALATA